MRPQCKSSQVQSEPASCATGVEARQLPKLTVTLGELRKRP